MRYVVWNVVDEGKLRSPVVVVLLSGKSLTESAVAPFSPRTGAWPVP